MDMTNEYINIYILQFNTFNSKFLSKNVKIFEIKGT